jgi:hypothetical protein
LINNTHYKVTKSGNILSKIVRGAFVSDKWHRVDRKSSDGYRIVVFKYKRLNAVRIVFAKFGNSSLIAEKVINHKDGNKENNNINNLELVTYSENNIHRYQILEGKIPKLKNPRLRRSGMLLSTCDDLIRDLLNNPNYEVKKDGTVWTKITQNGKESLTGIYREAGYIKRKKRQ